VIAVVDPSSPLFQGYGHSGGCGQTGGGVEMIEQTAMMGYSVMVDQSKFDKSTLVNPHSLLL